MSFDDDVAAQIAAEKDFVNVDVTLNGKLYTFRFFQMDGLEWADQTDRFPARPGVLLDMRYGYNLRPLSKAVAPLSGKQVDGDTLIDLTPEQWEKLFKALPGAAVMRIGDALFNLNEYAPGEAVEAAKKASAAESALSSASLVSKASLEVDSSDANLESSPPTDTTTPES